MLIEYIREAASNSDALSILVEKFDNLLKKHARELGYEDAYHDMVISFIKLIRKMSDIELESESDAAIVKYIHISVRNEYIKLSKENSRHSELPFSGLSDSQQYYVNSRVSELDDHSSMLWEEIKPLLTEREFDILRLWIAGYSISMIADMHNSSRQAINQSKKRAFSKLNAYFGIK